MKIKNISKAIMAIVMTLLLIQPSDLKAEAMNANDLVNHWTFGRDISGEVFDELGEEWILDEDSTLDVNLHLDILGKDYASYTFGPLTCSDPSVVSLDNTKYYNNEQDTLIAASGVLNKDGDVYYYMDVEKDGIKQTLKSDIVKYRKKKAEITAFTLNDQNQFVKADTLKTGVTYYVSATIGGIPIHETNGRFYIIETNNHAQDRYFAIDTMSNYTKGDPYAIEFPYNRLTRGGGEIISDYDLILKSDVPKDIAVSLSIYPGLGGTGKLMQKCSTTLSIKEDNPQPLEPSNPDQTDNSEQTEKPIQQTVKDNDTNILISGALMQGTVLMAQQINENDIVKKSMVRYEKYEAFDLSLMKDDVHIQPNGKIKVFIPIPETFDHKSIKIYYVDAKGMKTVIPHEIIENFAVFETDHFSTYVIAEEPVVQDTIETTKKSDAEKASTNKSEKKVQNTVNTGDNTNMLLYGGLMVSAIGALTILKVRSKKSDFK